MNKRINLCRYTLHALVEHAGETDERGHYCAYVRDGDRWLRKSDTAVAEVAIAEVLHAEAFMLFYQRDDSATVREMRPPAAEIGSRAAEIGSRATEIGSPAAEIGSPTAEIGSRAGVR